MEMDGGPTALSRLRTGSWGWDLFLTPPELPGRESGGELEKSRTMSSPGVVAPLWLPSREGNLGLLSSATRLASSKGVRPAGGVHRPPPTEAGVEAPDTVVADSWSIPEIGCVALRCKPLTLGKAGAAELA